MATVLVAAIAGCASPKYNYVPQVTQISYPSLGGEAVANVGDTMVSQGAKVEHQALQVDQDIGIGLFNAYTVTRGVYLKIGEDEDMEFYAIVNPFVGGGTVQKTLLADPVKGMGTNKSEHKICGISVFNAKVCTSEGSFSRIQKPMESSNSFQQALIYSGKVGSRIRLGYREFSGNAARPAFNNDVDYDLTESKVVGYKGARIEVIEATNEQIRYRLISNFNVAH